MSLAQFFAKSSMSKYNLQFYRCESGSLASEPWLRGSGSSCMGSNFVFYFFVIGSGGHRWFADVLSWDPFYEKLKIPLHIPINWINTWLNNSFVKRDFWQSYCGLSLGSVVGHREMGRNEFVRMNWWSGSVAGDPDQGLIQLDLSVRIGGQNLDLWKYRSSGLVSDHKICSVPYENL